jgi:type 1 glutamine amidotransferase
MDRQFTAWLMRCLLVLGSLAGVACSPPEVTVHDATAGPGAAIRTVVFLAGPDSHGPWAHEHRRGSELLAAALRERDAATRTVMIYGGWPEDVAVFDNADAVVIYCDGGSSHLINEQLAVLRAWLDDGVGVAALHYAVEVPKGSPSAQAMLEAVGGYFETDWSVNPHWTAHFSALPPHPVAEGVEPFAMKDEWYFNMRFVDRMTGVTPLLVAVPPASTMERSDGPHSGNPAVRAMVERGQPQVLAWAYQRPGGGRGFGYTGGHFHANWEDDNARQLVLNAIEWVASR